jgi:hypothetical protein
VSAGDGFETADVHVEPYLGSGSAGPVYGPPDAFPCLLSRQTRMVRDAQHREVVSSATLYATDPALRLPRSGDRAVLPDGARLAVIATVTHEDDTDRVVEVQLA